MSTTDDVRTIALGMRCSAYRERVDAYPYRCKSDTLSEVTTEQRAPGSSGQAVWMSIGAPVTLLPIDLDIGLLRGEVTHWLGGAGGQVATIGVRTSAETAATCTGHRVWLSGRDAVGNDLLVLDVVARRPPRFVETALALTGIMPVAREHRRASVRAPIRHPVRLTFDDGATADGIVDDLSRSGCLISMNHADVLPTLGAHATVAIELPGNVDLALTGDVVRTASVTGQLALRIRPAEIDLAIIDRLVYSAVQRT